MISVNQTLEHLFSLVDPLQSELCPLRDANGRILASDVTATRDQPPFSSSAMDGYAVESVEIGAQYDVIGEAAAGHGFSCAVGPGQAVRIFTGAPVPQGAKRVVIQEDVTRDGNVITITDRLEGGPHIRPAASDFAKGDVVAAPLRLGPSELALLAAMNIDPVPVMRKPQIALLATGDELVMPGETPDEDQIIASNIFGLKALLEQNGAACRILPIARDNTQALTAAFELAASADLLVTIGGASVGDHDLVGQVAADLGMKRAFYKIAMRPGKPLMAGRLGDLPMIGLPGNPVSAMVCGHIFLLPVLRKMLGLDAMPTPRKSAALARDIGQNGPREHYMRAKLNDQGLSVDERQDSSLLSVLALADALVVRPPNDPERKAGDIVDYVPLR